MVVRRRSGLFELLFAVCGSILPKVWRKIVLVAAVSAAAVLVERQPPSWFPSTMGIGPFTLIGLAVSIAYTFFDLDALTCEIKEPFGAEANDLPLEALVAVVEGAVQTAPGEAPPSAAAALGNLLP